ncbi:MAG: hypothetical protein JWN50_31 [Parcubacteria group bacterium]|nr:hypothetical protein [Parcubacteria group bacterium]
MRFEYGRLAPFCRIEKEGLNKAELGELADGSCERSRWARDFMNRPEFVPSVFCERVDFAILSPRYHFGCEFLPSTKHLLDHERLKEWSRLHLFEQSIELCEPDDALYIRTRYLKQPEGEVLQIAMTPLPIYEGIDEKTGKPWKDYAVFHLEHTSGMLWLRARYALAASCQDLDGMWIFRIRNTRALPR